MRPGRIWLIGAIAFFAGASGCCAACSAGLDDSLPESRKASRQSAPVVEQVEAQEMVVELVEPPSLARTLSPTGILRRMYPSLRVAEGFCWEEAEAAYEGESPRIDTGLAPGADPPADLLAFFEGQGESYDDYEHRWFNRNQLLFMHQEMFVTEGGRRGPRAVVTRIVRREGPDGQQFWEEYDAAAMYPCD